MGVVKCIYADTISAKLKNKGETMIFVGYCLSHSPHTYRMFNMKTEHVVFSRDISWLNMTYGFWKKKKKAELETSIMKDSEVREFKISMPEEKKKTSLKDKRNPGTVVPVVLPKTPKPQF